MKKIWNIIFLIIILVLGLIGWKYYNTTYTSEPAYVKVPNQIPKKEQTVDDDGKVISGSYSYRYKFNFVTKNGDQRRLNFVKLGDNKVLAYRPGAYLKAEISKKRVVKGPWYINQKEIDNKVLSKIH